MPSLIWLYFLLKEDARCPEPKVLIALTFIAGIAAVPLALPLEQAAVARFGSGFPLILSWAAIEEILKYAMAAAFILWRRAVDESPDYVIYMITVALGFAAAENVLFLFAPLATEGFSAAFLTSNYRFLGANLLHITASAAVGFSLAFSFNWRPKWRTLASATGLILAIALHTAFNMLIISEGVAHKLSALFLVWAVVLVFFAAFEILKYLRYRKLPKNTC